MHLVPLKVKIGLRPNGHADHPDWTKLPSVGNDNTRGHAPFSWMYDNIGHEESRADGDQWDSPRGMQWGVFLCAREFADEALATFPDTISELSAADFEDFYNNKHKASEADYRYDHKMLDGLRLERELKVATKANAQSLADTDNRIAKALDPDDPARGRSRNKGKTLKDFKEVNDVQVD